MKAQTKLGLAGLISRAHILQLIQTRAELHL